MPSDPGHVNPASLPRSSPPERVLGRERRLPLVIGIGHPLRHDDAVGLTVARRVGELAAGKVRIAERSGEGTDLLETWRGEETVALVDAASGDGIPGTVHRFEIVNGIPVRPGLPGAPSEARVLPLSFFRSSSHQVGLAEAVELGRALGALPGRLVIFAIEGADFTMGQGLTGPVAASVDGVASAVIFELEL